MQEQLPRLRARANGLPASGQGAVNIDIVVPISTCLLAENALLSTSQVASHLCGISFKATESANEILLNIIERRDPGALLSKDGSCGGLDLQERKSANSKKRLRESFNPFSTQRMDSYLNFLLENVSSKGSTSLSRGKDHRTTIHAGDVVVYEESNSPGIQVMAAAISNPRAARPAISNQRCGSTSAKRALTAKRAQERSALRGQQSATRAPRGPKSATSARRAARDQQPAVRVRAAQRGSTSAKRKTTSAKRLLPRSERRSEQHQCARRVARTTQLPAPVRVNTSCEPYAETDYLFSS
jgi:hypothetical protein